MSDVKVINLLFAGDFKPLQERGIILSNNLKETLVSKDFSIVNLEAPITSSSKPVAKNGNNFKLPENSVNHILSCSFDAVALSNNHIKDFGDQGLNDTINVCKQNNILTLGAGRNSKEASEPLRIKIKGKQLSFLNYCEEEFNASTESQAGANIFNLISSYHQIKEEKQKSDFVFVIYHGGIEYQYLPTLEIVEIFKFLVDSGADGVIAHHTHRYSGTLVYNNKPILFGLGNFLSSTKNKNKREWGVGILAKIEIKEDVLSFDLIPTKMSNDFSSVEVLAGIEKVRVLKHINELSEIISNIERLKLYWDNEYSKHEGTIINLLKSDSKIEYKIRKRFPFVFRKGFSKYKLLNLLNLIRCLSHRNKVLSILSKQYKAINKA